MRHHATLEHSCAFCKLWLVRQTPRRIRTPDSQNIGTNSKSVNYPDESDSLSAESLRYFLLIYLRKSADIQE